MIAATWVAGCGSSAKNSGSAGGGGGSSATGGSGNSGGGSSACSGTPAASCAAIALASGKQVASTNTDELTWQDASCSPRTAALAKGQGAQARQFSYLVDGVPRTVTGTGVNGWAGFGYVVTHYDNGNNAATSQGETSTSAALFTGRHHAIYRFQVNHTIGSQRVPVTVDWFFATGQNSPVYAITYDTSGTQPGSVAADTRSPYGDMAWQGDGAGATVSGVGWGDRYKFVTTKEPLTADSSWDYTAKNTIPYAMEWETSPDAEMGIAQTQTYLQHDGGGYWEYGNWGKTSANQTKPVNSTTGAVQQPNTMPVSWNWTYQLNQYELCYPDATGCAGNTTTSHRLAWGANYGAVGGATAGSARYPAYGDDKQLVGHPYQSYSVYVVLGKHSDEVVAAQVTQVETVQNTKLTASVGTVDLNGPAGVGRTDTVTLSPAGWDARYGVWSMTAAGDAVKFDVSVSSGTLAAPILVINGYAKSTPPSVTVDGCTGVADADYFLSLDATNKRVWVTFRNGWTGTRSVEVK